MTGISRLRCVACGAAYDLRDGRTECECGGLVDVEHDLDAIAARYDDLRTRFERRLGSLDMAGRSGVWRYRELVLPELPIDEVVSLGEGSTGLYEGGDLGERLHLRRLWLKHEGENPTLSFKDRGMTSAVSWGRHLGARIGICASTGDTSASMAAYTARARGMRGVVLLPAGMVTDEQLAQAVAYGARVLALDTDFDGCMRVVQALARSTAVHLLNSKNPFRIEGQKTIGIEVVHQLGWRVPDWFVLPVGNAGNIAALGKGMREALALGLIDRLPRIAGAQVEAADPFFRAWRAGFPPRCATVTAGPTAASAIRIGDPVSYPRARRVVEETAGQVVAVSEAELLDAQALLGRCGVHACPNSAVALAGCARLATAGAIRPDDLVVVILTAHGAKFSSAGLAYHRGELAGITPAFANPPERLPARAESVAEALGISLDTTGRDPH
jgi:threonine synthase